MSEQSETPIGDAVESEVMAPGLVRGIAPHGTSEDQIQLTDPYTVPGDDTEDAGDPEDDVAPADDAEVDEDAVDPPADEPAEG